ncbi:hypothetical protein [Rhizobium sp. BK376]|uniref:hypothetical protein n=1 Tax=Rhizobium sp. BK376 TaxID=2512149 RepID=UPI001052603B|nr:hypothetical protein [Rhizobium sp. BK376]TCR78280.1 hypothetical protein EV561_1184 [Rhizobium sp. BK376]
MDNVKREQAFADSIDCRFPYSNLAAAAALIEEARSISVNAVFCIFYEIVCPPRSRRTELSRERQRELLFLLTQDFEHPLVDRLVEFAARIIEGRKIAANEAVGIIAEIGKFDGQYAALAAVSSLAYDALGEDFGALDALEDELRKKWDAMPAR